MYGKLTQIAFSSMHYAAFVGSGSTSVMTQSKSVSSGVFLIFVVSWLCCRSPISAQHCNKCNTGNILHQCKILFMLQRSFTLYFLAHLRSPSPPSLICCGIVRVPGVLYGKGVLIRHAPSSVSPDATVSWNLQKT